MQSVCAVIVTYNRLETLKTALSHILNQSVKPDTIIIVDNNSSDGTQDYLKTFDNHDTVKSMYMDSNLGSAGAISNAMIYGLTLKEYDYFWILDDDTFYEKNALSELIESIESS